MADVDRITAVTNISAELNEAITFYTARQVALESTVPDSDSPFADAINSIYQNVLRRGADSTGLSFWVEQINAGASLDSVRDALVSSSEATSTIDPIVRLYEVAFGRQPDEVGLSHWANAIRVGASFEDIAQGFTGSQEFISRFGTSTDRSAFVENLYQNGLGRASDAPGKAFWVNSAFTDEQLLLGFSESAESIARLDNFITILLTNLSDGFPAEALDSLTEVIAGQSGSGVLAAAVNLDNVALGDGGFKIISDGGSTTGYSVSTAGDVNGDGFDDVIVGAPGNGAAYVVFGAASGIASVSLATLGSGGIKFIGETSVTGRWVDTAGDFNGDGFDDLIVGDRGNNSSYVVFGTASGITSVNLATVASDNAGFKITGEGHAVSSAGDVNGDGFDDVIVGGTPFISGDPADAHVIFGAASGITSVNLSDVAGGIGGFRIIGEAGSNLFSVSTAGDFNGDGFVDVIVGGHRNDAGGTDAGAAYLVFGAASGITSVNLADVALGTGGFKMTGETTDDQAGFTVSSAGDFNNDGFDDLIIGAPVEGGNDAGAAYVVFGVASGISSINFDDVALGIGGFKITGESFFNDQTGLTVSNAGDVNGDGFDDVIVGAYNNDGGGSNAGAAYVVFGAASGITSVQLDDVTLGVGGFKITGETTGDGAGVSVASAGDVNADGFADLIVGAWRNDAGGNNAGAAYVIFGSATVSAVSQLSAAADEPLVQLDGSVNLLGVSLGDSGDVLI